MRKTLLLSFLFCYGVFHVVYAQDVAGEAKEERLVRMVEGGVLAGNSDNQNSAPFIFHASLNYIVNKRLLVGLGSGVEFMKETHIPATAHAMFLFGKRESVCPFVRLQGGYLFPLENKTYPNGSYYPYSPAYYGSYGTADAMDSKGGWMLNPSAGVIFYTKQKVGIVLSAGYRHQTLNYSGKKDYSMQVEQNRLSLTLGLIF